VAAACLWALGCGSGGSGGGSGGGALDGTWTWVSASCNRPGLSSTDADPVGHAPTTISGSLGEDTSTIPVTGESCTITVSFTVSYPSAGSFTFTWSSTSTIACSAGCSSLCSGIPTADCLCGVGFVVSNRVLSGTYTIQGNQATLTIPQMPADDSLCPSGLEVITLQK